MLELQSHPKAHAYASGQIKANTTGSHFSKAYVRLLIKDVQSVLASAGLASAAKQANRLLQACKPCVGAQALQQLMQEIVRSSEVGNNSAWCQNLYLNQVCVCTSCAKQHSCRLCLAVAHSSLFADFHSCPPFKDKHGW